MDATSHRVQTEAGERRFSSRTSRAAGWIPHGVTHASDQHAAAAGLSSARACSLLAAMGLKLVQERLLRPCPDARRPGNSDG